VVYCRRVAGSIGRLCVAVYGSDDERAGQLADDLGVALQLTNILRDVREDAEHGRTYLPAEDLARFGAPSPQTIGPLVAFEAARAREWYARGLELTALLDRRSAACVLAMSGIYRRLLDRIEADPQAILQTRVALSGATKLAVVARSLLGAGK
jgi:phytoene synthase